MKLLEAFKAQIDQMGELKRVWLTTFNLDIAFVETVVLPAVLRMEKPAGRMDYEGLQRALLRSGIDFRVYCDPRMVAKGKLKRTSIAVHPVSMRRMQQKTGLAGLDGDQSLFHPKVLFLDDGHSMVLGAGSANLTLSGWGRNQEAVDFRHIDSKAQYQQVKQFFLRIDSGLDEKTAFRRQRHFAGKDADWRFVHSLGGETLLQALSGGDTLKKLSVYSPYLADDLAGFVGKLGSELRVELVPDLLPGGEMRTRWSEGIQALLASERLAFFHPQIAHNERSPLTHAKIWLGQNREGEKQLAVGSWNFTHKGCSSLADHIHNIEAGIVHPVRRQTTICGQAWPTVDEKHFASEALLEEEKLTPGELPPCELSVIFDWTRSEYLLSGEWFVGKAGAHCQLSLPGLREPVTLVWKRDNQLKSPLTLPLSQSDRLLDNPFYTLHQPEKTDWQGMILEAGAQYRRSLSFASLDDLLSSYLSGQDPTHHEALILRSASAQDEIRAQGEATVSPVSQDVTSYFRLFQATQQRRQLLSACQEGAALFRALFSDPGSLRELAEFARAHIEKGQQPVFNWFLAQEINNLAILAKRCVNALRRREGAEAISVRPHLWQTLLVSLPEMKVDADSQRYLEAIKKECQYGE